MGLDLVQVTTEKIRLIQERLKTAQSQKKKKKSYAVNKRRELEFQVGDHVFLKVFSMKNVMRFGKKGKLSCDAPFPRGPVDHRQPTENLCVSYHETHT